MPTTDELAGRLRAAREAAGLTGRAAAARLGITPPQLSGWETGKNRPGIDSLERLAGAYGTTVATLLGDPAQPLPATTGDGPSDYWRGRMERTADVTASLRRITEEMARLAGIVDGDVRALLSSGALGASEATVTEGARLATAAAASRDGPPPVQDATTAAPRRSAQRARQMSEAARRA